MSMNSQTVEVLKKTFILATLDHEKGTKSGDHELANSSYQKLDESAKQLINIKAENVLEELAENEEVATQVWAAKYLIKIAPEKAKNVLQKVSAANIPFHSFSAQMLLGEL